MVSYGHSLIFSASDFPEGYQRRMMDFSTFERAFQQCVSKAAVRTKFEHHTQQGREIAEGIRTLLECVCIRADSLRTEQDEERLRQEHQFSLKTSRYELLVTEYRTRIEDLSRKDAQQVNCNLVLSYGTFLCKFLCRLR